MIASTIAVGYDGSDYAKAALNSALELATPDGQLGMRGESPFTGALPGSTAYQLVHRARRPVLVVPLRA